MTNAMSPDNLIGIANHASVQSDRWLFVALLVVGGFVAWLAAKWLASQYNRIMDQWRTDMKAMQDQLIGLHSERLKAAEQSSKELREIHQESSEIAREIIRAYSEALGRNDAALQRHAEVMERVQNALIELRQSVGICQTHWAKQ